MPQEAIAQEGSRGTANLKVLDTLCSFTVPAHLLSSGATLLCQRELLASMWPDGLAEQEYDALALQPAWTAPLLQITEVQQTVRL